MDDYKKTVFSGSYVATTHKLAASLVPVCSQDKPNASTERCEHGVLSYPLAEKLFGIDAYESERVMDSSGSSCTSELHE